MHWEPSLLRRYLLGELSEDARVSLDLKLLSSDEFITAVEVAEEELIDDYLDGLLTGNEVESFRQFFLNSAERIAKIEFSRQLKQHTIEIGRSKEAEMSLGYASRPWSFFRTKFAILSVATILLVLLGLSYLVLRRSISGEGTTAGELAELNHRDLSNLPELASLSRLTLVSEVTRDSSQPRTLSLQNVTELVLLRMALPEEMLDDQVGINIDNNGTSVRLEKINVYTTQAGRDVRILLPRAKLMLGKYTVKIAGNSSAYAGVTYEFQVEP